MDLEQLRYFVRVAEQGSFSKAAVLLDIAQPTLSRSVRSLEVELKASLFHRNGRGVLLTDDGRVFLNHARGVLRGADAALKAVGRGEPSYAGRVAAGLPPSLSKLIILPLVSTFRERFPRASLGVVDGLSSALYDQLLSGRLDFAILHNPAASPQLAIEPIVTEPLVLIGNRQVGRRAGSVGLADLEGLPLVMASAPHALRPLIEAAMARAGLPMRVAIEVDSIAAIIDLATAGTAFSIVSESTIAVVPASVGLHRQRIDAPGLETTLCLAAPARQPRTPLPVEVAQLCVELLRKALGLRRRPARIKV